MLSPHSRPQRINKQLLAQALSVILWLDPSNFSDICDALKLCRDPTSPVEIKHSAFYPFLKSALPLLNDQPTDKRSFLGGNQKRLRFFTPQRGRIGSFGSNIFSKLGQPTRPQPTSRPVRAQNHPFSNTRRYCLRGLASLSDATHLRVWVLKFRQELFGPCRPARCDGGEDVGPTLLNTRQAQ